ncbi:DUF6259 domain-containing protein [Bacillaceae bacterium CLA-AA-H227]|uniref:DUF6259 domain-containing protein n=1 Tax=Robertmurraya yapensis (ex Hitch et al 2024) TaxID=3133160 RepID=A0ACC6SB23_9BACI
MIFLENDFISISFHKETGSICSLIDKQKKIEYIPEKLSSVPFRVELEEETITDFHRFSYEADKERLGYKFVWELAPDLALKARVWIQDDSNEVSFDCELQNDSSKSIYTLEYPIIPNIGNITEQGEDDYLAHSFATGFLIHNPLKNFTSEWNGFRYMPYPEGFSGSTMQFFSYYGKGQGGLYFAAYDADSYTKWLNFYKNEQGFLEATFLDSCEDIGPHKGITVNYPIVIKTLEGHNWYEAADIYKDWAVNQYWCQKGELSKTDDKCDWLLDDVGLSTFGINAGADRAEWIEKYHEHIDTKMLHILGPDWTNKIQSFGMGIPGGYKDWFPTRFNEATLNAIRENGDKFAPFEFDYLFNLFGADGIKGKRALQEIPRDPSKSIDQYKFPFVCPADPYVQDLHVRRDETLQLESNVDSIYYDISANNIMKLCMDDSHGHTKGAGRQITQAYRENYINTKEAMSRAADGRYIPMGTEMINEVFLDVLDYYQTRAGGAPAAPLEGYNVRELLKKGEAELIPMFTYVYHEYGAVRLDGWGKIVEEIGDLFYFHVARTYLWGGLYELNYEYSPMEVINEKENSVDEHYYPFEARGYGFSQARAEYISKFAKLRTGAGNKYLAYGRMLKPFEFEVEKVNLNWFIYNCAKDHKEYNDTGELVVDSIIHSAWQYQDESIGLFFANVSDEAKTIQIKLDLASYFATDSIKVDRMTENEKVELLTMNPKDKQTVDVQIPAKGYILLEVN